MTSNDKKSATTGQPGQDPDALRAEIAELRADLGDTVEALAAKVDVKARAQAKVAQTAEQLREGATRYRPWPQVAAGAAVAVVLLGGLAMRRLRRR